MREFNQSFQPIQDDEAQDVDDSVDWGSHEWGTHRFHVRQLLEHAIDSLSVRDKAVVLGAANHGDVDLPELASQFTQLTVLDTDGNAIEEVLEQSGSAISGKVKSLTNVDYTCLDQIHFYETWEEMLNNHAPVHEINTYLKNCSFEARRHEALPHLKKSFSLVVSSSVHTQLFYIHAATQFSDFADHYNSQEIGQVMESLMYLRNSLVSNYNRLLVSLLKPEGRLVVWSDMISLDQQDPTFLDDLYGFQTEEERLSFLFRSFGEIGIESAVLGIKGLYDLLKPEGQLFKSWVSVAESDKQFIVAGFSGTLRK